MANFDRDLGVHEHSWVTTRPDVNGLFPAWPSYEEDEIEAVTTVLRSGRVNYWTGEHGRCFEREFASFCRVPYAVAVTNGSVGLEAALVGLDIAPGDEVVVTPRSFVASANAVVLRGATPVFVDVDPNSQNISAEAIEGLISEKTRAILVVHLAGWPAEMDVICELAGRKGLSVIEDCAQAHGAQYRGRPVGSFGDVGVFSFCQDKIMTTGGEGGMVVTRDSSVWERAWAYRDHGRSGQDADPDGSGHSFSWVRGSFGTNWRLTEMQAAIGRLQLKKLPQWKRKRQENASILASRFAEIDALRVTHTNEFEDHAYYKYYVFVHPDRLRKAWSRDRIIEEINASGIPCFSGSCPEIYREKAYIDAGLVPSRRLPIAKMLGETSLMFPVHPTLEPEHMDCIGSVAKQVITRASSR